MRRGRPKMSQHQHLGLKDELKFAEIKEMLTQVYETNGVESAREILRQFHVERLSQLPLIEWPRFVRVCKNRLNPQ